VRAISDLERGVHRAPRLESVRMLAAALSLNEAERGALLATARPIEMATREARSVALGRSTMVPPLSQLIGRDTEVNVLRERLQSRTCRLLPVTGPGGVGKTRLAMAVASEVVDQFAERAACIDLTALTDPDLVLPAVAEALGVPETARRT